VYSNVIRLGDGGIRTEAARFAVLLSAVIALDVRQRGNWVVIDLGWINHRQAAVE